MTLRSKTAIKRTHRPAHDADHRRNLLLNIGFGLVVVLALLILAGAAFASWYGDHLEALARVNGQSISKDDFRERARVNTFRLDYLETQIRQRMLDGKLSDSAGQNALSQISERRQSLETDTVENLIDVTLMGQLATQQSVTVSEQQVDAELVKEATTLESRHLWVIGIKPVVSADATKPTDQQKADAKAAADKALADLKAGTPWTDVAKVLKDDRSASTAGDAGWLTKGGSLIEQPLDDALFALPVNGITDVMEGTDGMFRIGRVTEIDPAVVDEAFQQKIKDSGIGIDGYRKVARADALQTALNDKLIADVVNVPTAQRHIQEIFLAADSTTQEGVGDEVQVRHILFSPNDDAQAAQTLPSTDPAWKKAEDEANATFADLQKDPSKFQEIAKASSDDEGTKADGGLLQYYTRVNLDKAFADAIFQDGLQKDQILAPVKSAFGWHVIQFLDRRKPASERMADIKAQASAAGADFAAIAKANSEADTKDQGGDAGWIAKYQFDSVREIAIFKAPIGGLSEVVTTSDGLHLYKIVAEEMRLPDAAQAETIKANAFNNWYTAERNSAKIERLYDTSGAQVPAVQ